MTRKTVAWKYSFLLVLHLERDDFSGEQPCIYPLSNGLDLRKRVVKEVTKKLHRATRAILVLECPWELDQHDCNRTSVLPFVEGVAKYAGDTEVFHANFYDNSSFNKALDCLTRCRADNTLVYIAAHGYRRKIAGTSVDDLIFAIGESSKDCNITGLILGSCYVGQNTSTMEAYMEGTTIRWCTGYASSCDWMAGTMIDCAIMASMLELDEEDLAEREIMVESLAAALSPFSRSYVIGEDYNQGEVALEDSISFVVQPSGRGNRAKTVSEDVLDVYEAFQKYD